MCSWPRSEVRARVTRLNQLFSVNQSSRHQRQEGRTGDQLLTLRWPGADGAEKPGLGCPVVPGGWYLALVILGREKFISDPQRLFWFSVVVVNTMTKLGGRGLFYLTHYSPPLREARQELQAEA